MRPAISYYGSKARLSKHMPPPIYDHIIEPFAGGAAYALRWRDRSVTLIDLDEVLCAMWSYLIGAPAQELLALPLIAAGDTTDDHTWPCPEARDLVGYWLSPGSSYPCRQPSSWAGYGKSSTWCEATRTHVAQLAETIRHWRVTCGDYTTAPNVPATWFIDPPYQGRPGSYYRHGSDAIDYEALGTWCEQRQGQVIVCEHEGATWLPFEPLRRHRGLGGKNLEVIAQLGLRAQGVLL